MRKIDCLTKEQCTGCSCCKNVCPTNAITFAEDHEGFLYPNIDYDKCIDCGLCYKTCPSIKQNNLNAIKNAYVAINTKDNRLSTSGGIFPLLVDFILKHKGYVCGTIIDEDNTIKHVVSNDLNVISKMRGSKYTQSSIEGTFSEIKKILDSGKYCLFTGTPCQVAGLKSYLKGENNKLICVDIVCHGVSNQKFLKKNIKEKYKNAKLISFREKNIFEGSVYKICFKKNNKTIKKYYYEDAYYESFMRGISFRESCYKCHYATSKRIGDITIGDSACYRNNEIFKYDSAPSIVLINTDKGKFVFDNIKNKLKYDSADLEKEIKNNEQLNKPTERKKERDEIFVDLNTMNYDLFYKKYVSNLNFNGTIKRDIKRLIPQKIKRFIKKEKGK